ncbi:hypothetical protein QE429_004735 [Bacillus sp. SORGH_AS 510]|uniref:hypothetical protein n=1 Tax=Bacillus sp. SORGH_AS_0510 TaxID=3041771 RepID=UPI00277E586D|nr:hypothetical protein [Bacillus sp. SORGH_AS_0510]MDQ1147908.1 hypothetical protein [Bacillus sp. SORGH_AS_0510]
MGENLDLFFDDNNEEQGGCDREIKKKVSVVAGVKIHPIVELDECKIEIKCCGPLVRRDKRKHSKKRKRCEFIVEQKLCVNIPIHFDAETEVIPLGIVCNPDMCD